MSDDPNDIHNSGQADGAKEASEDAEYPIYHPTNYEPPHQDIWGNRSDSSVLNTPEQNEERKADNDSYDAGFKHGRDGE